MMRMKVSATVHLVSTALVIATAVAVYRLRAEGDEWGAERQRVEVAASALQARVKADEENVGRLEAEDAALEKSVKELGGKRSPAFVQLVDRGLAALHAQATGGTAAQSEGATMASAGVVQGKAGRIYFTELLDRSDYARAAAVVERLQIERTYALLLRDLKLTPEQRVKLTDLLLDREMAKQDILGIDQQAEAAAVTQHRLDAAREWRTRVVAAFSVGVFNQIRAYDGTIPLRGVVEQVRTRTAATESPLSAAQAERLLAALTGALGTTVGTRYWSIPDNMIARLRPELSSGQIAALVQIQQEQAALIEAREARAGNRAK